MKQREKPMSSLRGFFVNDVRKIQVVDAPPPPPRTSVTLELDRLHGLLVQGAISQIEFDALKAHLLNGL
jgi:hypothetical protein